MARTTYTASRRRRPTVRADTANNANAMAARESTAAATPVFINAVPTYQLNQPVLIQYRTDIWIPGVVTQHFYSPRYACLATEVEFSAADGSRVRSGFLDRDIRPSA